MSEHHVKIASELYSARHSMRILFPDVFVQRCKDWQETIKQVATINKCSEIEAMVDICKKLEGKEMVQIWVMAAYVEMVEPTP
jgi:hypothetical protein